MKTIFLSSLSEKKKMRRDVLYKYIEALQYDLQENIKLSFSSKAKEIEIQLNMLIGLQKK